MNTQLRSTFVGPRTAHGAKQRCLMARYGGMLAAFAVLAFAPPTSALSLFGGGTLEFSVAEQARVPITDVKRIAVLPFVHQGREDGITTDDVLTVLGNVRVNGEQFFSVYERKRMNDLIDEIRLGRSGLTDPRTALKLGKHAQVDGVIYGSVTQNNVKTSASRKDVGECIRTNTGSTEDYLAGIAGICFKKAKVPTGCQITTAVFTFNPKITVVETGSLRTVGAMSGSVTEEYCGEGARKSGEELLRLARVEAVKHFRDSVTPRERKYRILQLTKFCKKNKPKPNCDGSNPPKTVPKQIKAGLKWASGKRMRLGRACELWRQALATHNQGHVTRYWGGVCAEFLDSDFETAYALYHAADRAVMEPFEALNTALSRIAERKNIKATAPKGAPPATPRPVRKPDPVAREMQTLLNQSGYDAGPEDGFPGRRTRAALKEFQQDNGLDATGSLDTDTRAMLGMEE